MSTIAAVQKDLDALARQRMVYTIISIGAVLFLVVAGTMFAEARNAGSFVRGFTSFLNYPIDIISEAYEAGWKLPGRIAHFVPELVETVNAAFLSTLLGAITALIIALGSSRNMVKNPFIVQTCRRAMDIMRSFPELVLAMIFLYLMGKSILPAVLAIWIHTTGALGKLFSEAIENCDKGPVEGLQSVGGGWWKRIRFAVIPQVLPILLSYTLLRLEINVRASTILGFVGAGGIGEQLKVVIGWRHGDDVFAIICLLVSTIIALDYLSQYVRHRLSGLR